MLNLASPSLKSSIKLFASQSLRPAVTAAANHRLFIIRASSSSNHLRNPKMEAERYTFGPYKIDKKEVFYSTDLSYAMVNLRPLLPASTSDSTSLGKLLYESSKLHVRILNNAVPSDQ